MHAHAPHDRTKQSQAPPPNVLNSLECKFCVNTYRISFVQGTGDVMWRPRPGKKVCIAGAEKRLEMSRIVLHMLAPVHRDCTVFVARFVLSYVFIIFIKYAALHES